MSKMFTKRIAIIAGLFVLCLVGQVLLKSGLADNKIQPDKDTSYLKNQEFPAQDSDLTKNTNDNPPPFKTSPFLKSNQEKDNLQGQLLKQMFLMIGFIGIVGVGAWFFCKKMAGPFGGLKGKSITVAETVSLGPKKTLHIIEIGTKKLLIASAGENISMLADITDALPAQTAGTELTDE